MASVKRAGHGITRAMLTRLWGIVAAIIHDGVGGRLPHGAQICHGSAMAQRKMTENRWSIRWDEAKAEAAYAAGWWQKDTIADSLRHAASETPDRVLIVDGDVQLTAADLHREASQLAQLLVSRYPAGSVVSFMLPNWHEAAIIYLASTMANMVANPILPSLRHHDLRFILSDVSTRIIFAPREFRGFDYHAMLAQVASEMTNAPEVILVRAAPDEALDGVTSFAALMAETSSASLPHINADEVRMVMYTSGTTGRPKGVLHTHNSIHALIQQIGQYWMVDAGDRFLVPSPISHIGGSIYAFEMPLLLGTTAVLMESWDAGRAIPIMLDQGITHMAGATPFLQQLLDAAQAADTHLPALKVFICGGASVPPALIESAGAYFAKAVVTRVYGSTELPVTTVGALEPDARHYAAHSDGQAGFADVILADDGEIRARGPQMMLGYFHAEDEDSAFDAEGYYRSGDQGRWLDDRYLVVTGRIKDLIIRNGENIAPKEIEDLLVQDELISEIAIVGIPDPRTGEKAIAVIVPNGEAQPDLPHLVGILAGHGVAKFKYPERVELWDALPKNDAGKVLKNKIREILLAATL